VELNVGRCTLRPSVFVAEMAEVFFLGLDALRTQVASLYMGRCELLQDRVDITFNFPGTRSLSLFHMKDSSDAVPPQCGSCDVTTTWPSGGGRLISRSRVKSPSPLYNVRGRVAG
jgi:hypothetical protein